MKSGASISVILRTLGRNELLAEALESLARQTRRDFEVVVVDMNERNVSPVLERFHGRIPQVRHLAIGKPLVGAEATNEGIRHAAADKIAVLDDDNLYDPTHLEVLVGGLEQTGADLVYTGVRRTTQTPAGQLVDVTVWHRPYEFKLLLLGNYIHTAGTAFWKRTWERLGGFDPRCPVYDDYEFLLRVGATGRIACLPAVTAVSRSFTGRPGVQNHVVREPHHIRRCNAGVRWLHRKLISPERRRAAAEAAGSKSKEAAALPPPGGGLTRSLRRSVGGLRRRGEMAVDLLGWWWYHALPYLRRGTRNDCSKSA
jgi:hypothetical protein